MKILLLTLGFLTAFQVEAVCVAPALTALTALRTEEALLYTPRAFLEATKKDPKNSEISPNDNTFSLMSKQFCMRKEARDNEYFQYCERSTIRFSFGRGQFGQEEGGTLLIGAISGEVGVIEGFADLFEDVHFAGGALYASGSKVHGFDQPICVSSSGKVERPISVTSMIRLEDLVPYITYIIRIYDGQGHDMLAKLQILEVGLKGLKFKYEVLALDRATRD